jgi:hypothetical protein
MPPFWLLWFIFKWQGFSIIKEEVKKLCSEIPRRESEVTIASPIGTWKKEKRQNNGIFKTNINLH